MAIARGAGTEIIRTHMFEYAGGNTAAIDLIIGAQHLIYTVLSIVCFAKAASGGLEFYLTGYDCQGGDSAQNIILFQAGALTINQTYVINDKFSVLLKDKKVDETIDGIISKIVKGLVMPPVR